MECYPEKHSFFLLFFSQIIGKEQTFKFFLNFTSRTEQFKDEINETPLETMVKHIKKKHLKQNNTRDLGNVSTDVKACNDIF